MDSRDVDRIRHLLNTDIVRKMLIKYFVDKGFGESFDRYIYPPLLQDLPFLVPQLQPKLEVVPHAVELDPISQRNAKLGWNLFMLGNQRMFLGESHHADLSQLARQLATGRVETTETTLGSRQTTPRKVVHFVTRVLEDNRSGYTDLRPKIMPAMLNQGAAYKPKGGPSMDSSMFSRSGYGT